ILPISFFGSEPRAESLLLTFLLAFSADAWWPDAAILAAVLTEGKRNFSRGCDRAGGVSQYGRRGALPTSVRVDPGNRARPARSGNSPRGCRYRGAPPGCRSAAQPRDWSAWWNPWRSNRS